MNAGMGFWELTALEMLVAPVLACCVCSLVAIFRRDDLSGGQAVAWMMLVVLLPLIGSAIYIASRPWRPRLPERKAVDDISSQYLLPPPTRAEQLQVLADLHDRGKLTDEEFSIEKSLAG